MSTYGSFPNPLREIMNFYTRQQDLFPEPRKKERPDVAKAIQDMIADQIAQNPLGHDSNHPFWVPSHKQMDNVSGLGLDRFEGNVPPGHPLWTHMQTIMPLVAGKHKSYPHVSDSYPFYPSGHPYYGANNWEEQERNNPPWWENPQLNPPPEQ